MDQFWAIFALAVGAALFVLIAVVSMRVSRKRRRAGWRDTAGAMIPLGDGDGGDAGDFGDSG